MIHAHDGPHEIVSSGCSINWHGPATGPWRGACVVEEVGLLEIKRES